MPRGRGHKSATLRNISGCSNAGGLRGSVWAAYRFLYYATHVYEFVSGHFIFLNYCVRLYQIATFIFNFVTNCRQHSLREPFKVNRRDIISPLNAHALTNYKCAHLSRHTPSSLARTPRIFIALQFNCERCPKENTHTRILDVGIFQFRTNSSQWKCASNNLI